MGQSHHGKGLWRIQLGYWLLLLITYRPAAVPPEKRGNGMTLVVTIQMDVKRLDMLIGNLVNQGFKITLAHNNGYILKISEGMIDYKYFIVAR